MRRRVLVLAHGVIRDPFFPSVLLLSRAKDERNRDGLSLSEMPCPHYLSLLESHAGLLPPPPPPAAVAARTRSLRLPGYRIAALRRQHRIIPSSPPPAPPRVMRRGGCATKDRAGVINKAVALSNAIRDAKSRVLSRAAAGGYVARYPRVLSQHPPTARPDTHPHLPLRPPASSPSPTLRSPPRCFVAARLIYSNVRDTCR